MLTRLRVQNFKNLRDVEVYFGPLTVMAGPNGVGKSNLLDAIQFLGNTAAMTLTQAALKVRSKDANNTDVRKLFFADGAAAPPNIKFEADLILLPSARDKLAQTAHASSRFVTYSIEIAWSSEPLSPSPLKLVSENLRSKSLEHLPEPFFHLKGELEKPNAEHRYIKSDEPYKFEILHEAERKSMPILSNYNENSASVLSRVNGGGYPTATVVQQELQSWSAFQLYPDQLMRHSLLMGPSQLGQDGSFLAATLFRLAKEHDPALQGNREDRNNAVYQGILGCVRALVPDLRFLWVMLNESKTDLFVRVEDRWGNAFFPASLSEGTLRLIAFAALAEDESVSSLVTIEEPENGLHPRQMYQVLNVLRSITDSPSDRSRQVLNTTHSPSLVACVPEDAVLFASNEPKAGIDKTPNTLRLSCLSNTWRAKNDDQQIAAKGHIVSFLGVVPNPAGLSEDDLERLPGLNTRVVFEREEFLQYKLQSSI